MLFKIHEWYDKIEANWIRKAILITGIIGIIMIPTVWIALPVTILLLVWRIYYLLKKPKGESDML